MLNKDMINHPPRFWPRGVFLSLALIFADQFFKHFGRSIFRNAVFAFSLPLPLVLIYLVYGLVFSTMVYYVGKNYRTFSWLAKFAWTLIFSGAISNIGERIFLGYVRDWIYIFTGVFNLADGYILLGIIFLLLPDFRKTPQA